jgi:hypothetical protein
MPGIIPDFKFRATRLKVRQKIKTVTCPVRVTAPIKNGVTISLKAKIIQPFLKTR